VGIKPTTGETTPGDNLINIQQAAFAHADPESAKQTENLTVFFCTFGICMRKSYLMTVA